MEPPARSIHMVSEPILPPEDAASIPAPPEIPDAPPVESASIPDAPPADSPAEEPSDGGEENS